MPSKLPQNKSHTYNGIISTALQRKGEDLGTKAAGKMMGINTGLRNKEEGTRVALKWSFYILDPKRPPKADVFNICSLMTGCPEMVLWESD